MTKRNRVAQKDSADKKPTPKPPVQQSVQAVAAPDMAMQMGNGAFDTMQRQAQMQGLNQLVGNRQAQQMMRQQQANDNVQLKQIQRQEVIPVDIVEVPEHSGDVSEIVTDTLRTSRACLMNFGTAIENFETRISNESGQEAAPKDPAAIAMQQVGNFLVDQLTSKLTSVVPGGGIVKDLLGLGKKIAGAVEADRQRSASATDRNAAANFIISVRTMVSQAASDLEANMTEDITAAREEYDNAGSEGQKDAIRFQHELINSQISQLRQAALSIEALFTRIVESWINQTTTERGQPARVYINMDANWTVQEAYLDAPFGNRLAEQLEQQGPLAVMDLQVPRTVQWFPHYGEEGGGLVRCMADIDAHSGQATNVRGMGFQSRPYMQQFVNLLSTQPIPETTEVNGRQAN